MSSLSNQKKLRTGVEKAPKPPSIKFLTSAADATGFPADDRLEIGLVGRSNAGKSSLINLIFAKKIAKVSATPGKTTLLNFFDVGENYRLVDMPGYGFAARSPNQVNDWKKLIETYLSCRANLRGLILVMDIRRDWKSEEQQLIDWLEPIQIPVCLVLSKADKLSRNQQNRRESIIKNASGQNLVFKTDINDANSARLVERKVFELWIKANQ